jgi:hypothetical protein
MADRNKFEEMLEKLVNEDKKGAEDLFHEIVVEKSRTIYENLLENELEEIEDKEVDESSKDDEEVDEASKDDDAEDDKVDESADDEEVDESSDDEEVDESSDDEEVDENFGITPEAEADDDMGGDATDDMMADIEGGDEGDEDGEEEIEDRVVDLEDALDDLKAEFEKMMDGDKGGDEDEGEDDADMDMGDDEGDAEPEEEQFAPELGIDDQPAFEGQKSQAEQMREYVEKVSAPSNNADKSKSPVAGKNDMGGSAKNIAQGSGDEKGGTGASAPKEENAGNVNVPGGKASKSLSNAKGHGAEKKGAGEGSVDDKSIIGS